MTSKALTNKTILNIVGGAETADDILSKDVDGEDLLWKPPADINIPTGIIVMWSGSVGTIPTGWVICDGTNSTPDLRDRFIVGAGTTYAVDATGGSKDAVTVAHTHTASSSSSSTFTGNAGSTHSHTFDLIQADVDTFTGYGPSRVAGYVNGTYPVTSSTSNPSGTVSTTTTTTVSSTGSSGTNANLPPYYALAYIMKT